MCVGGFCLFVVVVVVLGGACVCGVGGGGRALGGGGGILLIFKHSQYVRWYVIYLYPFMKGNGLKMNNSLSLVRSLARPPPPPPHSLLHL